jgi:hypothetical protein
MRDKSVRARTVLIWVWSTYDGNSRNQQHLPEAKSQLGHRTRVLMTIPEVSIRCTGHLFAISSNLACCSLVSGPAK